MELWGLTGLAASGKSLALAVLRRRGVPTLDADEVSRQVVDVTTELGRETLSEIRALFGSDVIEASSGQLKRREIRQRISASPPLQLGLEKILHPRILGLIQTWARDCESQGHRLAVVEGTRLVESGYSTSLAGIVLLSSDNESRVRRLMARDQITEFEARQLLAMQNEAAMRAAAKEHWVNLEDDAQRAEAALEKQIAAFLEKRKAKHP